MQWRQLGSDIAGETDASVFSEGGKIRCVFRPTDCLKRFIRNINKFLPCYTASRPEVGTVRRYRPMSLDVRLPLWCERPKFTVEQCWCALYSLPIVLLLLNAWFDLFVSFQITACRVKLKRDGTRWRTEEEVRGKLANGVGSQYPSHYLVTWCIQHYYRWCAHLGCQ